MPQKFRYQLLLVILMREKTGIRDREDGKRQRPVWGLLSLSPLTDRLTGYDIVCLQT